MADSKTSGAEELRPFDTFVASVRDCVQATMADLIKSAGNDEDAPALESTAGVIKEQFAKALDEVTALYAGANAAARSSADDFLRVQSGIALTNSISATTRKVTNAKIGRGFLSWLSKNFTEIKKLIGMIIGFISDKAKEWWDKISVFLDELINLLLSLLGGVFGMNRLALAEEMSQGEVHYLNEMAALRRLERAGQNDAGEERG